MSLSLQRKLIDARLAAELKNVLASLIYSNIFSTPW